MTQNNELVLPIVHLNGTSREELLQLREDFYAALDEAILKLCKMAPNARDYYLVPGCYEPALGQHIRRLEALNLLRLEIEQECQAINEL